MSYQTGSVYVGTTPMTHTLTTTEDPQRFWLVTGVCSCGWHHDPPTFWSNVNAEFVRHASLCPHGMPDGVGCAACADPMFTPDGHRYDEHLADLEVDTAMSIQGEW